MNNDLKTLITVYNAIVRSVLSYASVIWNPSQAFLGTELERVQRNFIRYLCYKLKIDCDYYTYEQLCQKFEMPTLHHFRSSLGLNLLYNLIHGRIQCSAMLKNIYIRLFLLEKKLCSEFHLLKLIINNVVGIIISHISVIILI